MHVSLNMAMSLDGKIATAQRGPVKLGSGYDFQRMGEIRAEHQAVINGAATFRAYPKLLHVQDQALLQRRQALGWSPQPISAIASSRLELPKGTPWEKAVDSERWAFCGAKAPRARINALEKAGVKVVRSRQPRPGAKEILRAFERAGITKVLLEGGGEFNASFLELGLVDKIYLTVVPILIGGKDSPTWCEGKGFKAFPRFRLRSQRELEGELYLEYEKTLAPLGQKP